MKLNGTFVFVWAGLFCAASAAPASTGAGPRLPFSFVENRGQADESIRFIGEGPGFAALFTCRGVLLRQGAAALQVTYPGGKDCAVARGTDPSGAQANYLFGPDASAWITGLPMYSGVLLSGMWQGVDVRYQAEDEIPAAEYVVHPGADPDVIRLRLDGVANIERDGSLTVRNASGVFREKAPFLYQQSAGSKIPVAGSYAIAGDGTVGFRVAAYDRSRTLIIDPSISFSGYFGGSSQTTITAMVVNSVYNTVVTGWTLGTDLPASAGAKKVNSGGVDAFVAAFSPAGGSLLYCTYLGGKSDDRALGIAVDAANNTYITGYTSSTNFALLNPMQATLSGARDAFVAKLNPSGNALLFSTLMGGTGADSGNAIAVDTNGTVLVAGDTTSANLPVSAGAFQPRSGGNQDVVIVRIAGDGRSLLALSYFGGGALDHVASMKLDSAGNVVFGGSTTSSNLPVASAYQPYSGGGQDGFVAKMSSTLGSLVFSSYVGGRGGAPGAPEEVNAVLVTPTDLILVAGTTSSPEMAPSFASLQPVFGGGNTDGFVMRLSSPGALQKFTFWGGSGDDGIKSISCDFSGLISVAGFTTSTDLNVKSPLQASNGGGLDGMIARFSFAKLLFSTYLGGSGNDSANVITVDSMTGITIAGTTGSSNFPLAGSVGGWMGSNLSSFLTKLQPGFTLGLFAGGTFTVDSWNTTGYNGSAVVLNQFAFGQAGDIGITGDWTGSGIKRMAVFRNGLWMFDLNGNGVFDAGDRMLTFGQAGDIPVVGDWTGDGRIKLGLFRAGTFILDLSGHLSGAATGLADVSFVFGQAGDIPICSDWNGTGITRVGVFRAGQWFVDLNGDRVLDSRDPVYTYGSAGDRPVVGDWDGTGAQKIGVYRNGLWTLNYLGNNVNTFAGKYELVIGFGGSSYLPLVF